PRPAMERAADLGEPAPTAFAQGTPAVTARVLEGAKRAVVAAHDHHGQRSEAVLVPVTGRGDVVERGCELPDTRPEKFVLLRGVLRRYVARRRDRDGHASESSRFRAPPGNHGTARSLPDRQARTMSVRFGPTIDPGGKTMRLRFGARSGVTLAALVLVAGACG